MQQWRFSWFFGLNSKIQLLREFECFSLFGWEWVFKQGRFWRQQLVRLLQVRLVRVLVWQQWLVLLVRLEYPLTRRHWIHLLGPNSSWPFAVNRLVQSMSSCLSQHHHRVFLLVLYKSRERKSKNKTLRCFIFLAIFVCWSQAMKLLFESPVNWSCTL